MSGPAHPSIPTDGWQLLESDQALADELAGKLPGRVFDAHTHVYDARHFDPVPAYFAGGHEVARIPEWRRALGELVGGAERLAGALVLPFPSTGAPANDINQFAFGAVANAASADGDDAAGAPKLATAVLVDPARPREESEPFMASPSAGGFKVYHLFATGDHRHVPGTTASQQAYLEEFVPEWVWEEADRRGWFIMLHIVRARALADPDNQRYLVDHCRRYPAAKLVLAHAGRSFNAHHTVSGVGALRGLDNVWFDTSAICEPEAFVAILRELGPRRLMYGSDFPITHLRGRVVSAGDGFIWATTDTTDWSTGGYFGQPVQVGLESLRALLQACEIEHLDSGDRQDVFCDNAERMLGLREEPAWGWSRYPQAKELMPPYGVQLGSKSPESHAPELWPPYFREARGVEIVDVDGNRWWDVGHHGIGACALGYRDPDVTEAVMRRVSLGSYSILNHPEEPEVAELLCQLHPWAQQVRFARSGGETMAIAVRIARATTDRSLVAVCGYHGWHDWYLAANLGDNDALLGHLMPGLDPVGVPRELRGTNLTFTFNNPDELDAIIADHGDRLAAVVMEPVRYHRPDPGFLEHVRDQAHRAGALLLFDEISVGWRFALGGSHLMWGVDPDIACFAKALGSGHPMGAVIGSANAMAGLRGSFISSTYWTEGVGFVAAAATIKKMQRVDLPAHCERVGSMLLDAWRDVSSRHGVPLRPACDVPNMPIMEFDHPQARELSTLYTQLMLDHGMLAGLTMFISLAHTDEVLSRYIEVMDPVFEQIAAAIDSDSVVERMRAPRSRGGFRRLTGSRP